MVSLAMQLVRDGKRDEALLHLAPIANNPHGGSLAEAAKRQMERLKAGDLSGGDGEEPLSGTEAPSGMGRPVRP